MRSLFIEVLLEFSHSNSQRRLTCEDGLPEQAFLERPDEPLRVAILPWRVGGCAMRTTARSSQKFPELLGVDGIAVHDDGEDSEPTEESDSDHGQIPGALFGDCAIGA